MSRALPILEAPTVPLSALDQLWFQVAGTVCNLRCSHCFISCSPDNHSHWFLDRGQVREALVASESMGVKEYYFTGGEPFMNREMTGILEDTMALGPATVLTNATLLPQRTVDELARIAQDSLYTLELRVSIDGTTAEMNDALRGEGAFERAMAGMERLVSAGFLPIVTAMQTWDDFLDTFGRAAEEAEAIVGVLAGSSLSGTFRSGEAAASRFQRAPVHLADSLGASLLQGLLVLKACELAELAWAPADIVREIDRVRTQSGILFTVDTFDRLIASGRMGRGRALLGRVRGIKPILQLSVAGEVEPIGRALGMDRAGDELMRQLRQRIPQRTDHVRFGVVHVGAPDVVGPVTTRLRAEYGDHVEVLTAPVTPVIATHLGIGAWGVAYLVEHA